jgi:hypothetical protein
MSCGYRFTPLMMIVSLKRPACRRMYISYIGSKRDVV